MLCVVVGCGGCTLLCLLGVSGIRGCCVLPFGGWLYGLGVVVGCFDFLYEPCSVCQTLVLVSWSS